MAITFLTAIIIERLNFNNAKIKNLVYLFKRQTNLEP